jgi:hypothetical protein
MRENNENWEMHLTRLIVELAGLNEIFPACPAYVSLLSKLEGLKI